MATLKTFLNKFQTELEEDQITSLGKCLSLGESATREDVTLELEKTVQMSVESLEDLIKKLEELKIGSNHIERVNHFKDRHFKNFSSESWSEQSSDADYTHNQCFPTPVSHVDSGDEASDLNPPTAKRQKSDADSLVQDEDEEEHINDLATGDDKKFLEQAVQIAKKSGDPYTKVGAILVNLKGRMIGIGYNDLPRKNLTSKLEKPWKLYTHAADEAIMDALKRRESTKDSTLYTTAYPSCRDAVRIYRAGIKEVVYMKKLKSWRELYDTEATEMLFKGEINTRKLCL